jgi:hypothetical protein
LIANADALLKPLALAGLTIPNRVMSTSHAPGYDGRDETKGRVLIHPEPRDAAREIRVFLCGLGLRKPHA